MTQAEQDRPDDESDDSDQQAQTEESQQSNFVPGSAADPAVTSSSPGVGSQAYYGPVSNPEERNWSLLVHLSAFAGLLFPFANIIAPLVVWLIFRARSDMVDFHGKRALNFQISITIWIVIAVLFSFVLIGIPFVIGLSIVSIVWTIIAAVRASRGDPPGYILSIGFLK